MLSFNLSGDASIMVIIRKTSTINRSVLTASDTSIGASQTNHICFGATQSFAAEGTNSSIISYNFNLNRIMVNLPAHPVGSIMTFQFRDDAVSVGNILSVASGAVGLFVSALESTPILGESEINVIMISGVGGTNNVRGLLVEISTR